MGFLKKLSSFFAPPTSSRSGKFYPLIVKCDRCDEILKGQINMGNDLSVGDGENADAGGFYCRKVLMGSQRCFQQIELHLKFDSNRRLVDRQVVGGSFVDEQD